MARLNNILVLFLSVLLVSTCNNAKAPAETTAEEFLVVPEVNQATAIGGSVTFNVVSGSDWYVRSSVAWIKVINATGSASSVPSPLTVTCEENSGSEARRGEIIVSSLGGEKATVYVEQEGGSGTSQEGRGISNAEDLLGFAKAVNGEGSIAKYLVNGTIKFMCDIDASSITEWIPAGTALRPLTYNIDGNGYAIKNVNWRVDIDKYPYAALIGYARGVTIDDFVFGSEGSSVVLSGNNAKSMTAGGVVGCLESSKITRVTNNVSLSLSDVSTSGESLIIGGIVGKTNQGCTLGDDSAKYKCVNNGNITAAVAARLGGLVGVNYGSIRNCINYGTITGPVNGNVGPGWLCSINNNKAGVVSNFGYGFVGTTPAMMKNSMMNYEAGYDIEGNTIDWKSDAYFDWTEIETRQLHSGLIYHHYDCDNIPRHVHVLEIDLSDTGIDLTAAYGGEMVPNPNGNGNHNNGFNLRETLSMLCNRRRAEGQKILAGTNGGFFDSNDGVSRGLEVEEGEPVYINNPRVVSSLVAQMYGLTVFSDRTGSLGVKKFTGKIRSGGRELNYQTYNDTTMRHASPSVAPVNLYNWRYVRTPYPTAPSIINDMAADVLYIICEYTSGTMKVNGGYAPAKVIDVRDGRNGTIYLPYLTSKNQVGIAMSGTAASSWSSVKVGDTVELRCDISIDGDSSKPIQTLVSTKNQYMLDGKDNDSEKLDTDFVPKTFPVLSKDRRKIWLVVVDGRQGWYSIGVKGYDLYGIAKKLGGWWSTGLDGGGSSTMWTWDASKGNGSVVNSLATSERSCLNYIVIREK